MRRLPPILALVLFFPLITIPSFAQEKTAPKPRARDLGVPFDGTPGPFNAITDVAGVTVGHTTLISGEGKLVVGKGPVRTGVTAVLPQGKDGMQGGVFAGWFSQNGNGEMTGTTWVEESGFLVGPVMITNTHSVGVVRDAVIQWLVTNHKAGPDDDWWSLPVVAETWDGWLNDINGFHVKPEHAFHAIESAHGGAVEEGEVGGGTGMICNGYKGGIGTSSRKLSVQDGGYTVGVLVQCNYGVAAEFPCRGNSRGARNSFRRSLRDRALGCRGTRLHHCSCSHGCAASSHSIEALGSPRDFGYWPQREHFRQWFRRYFYRLLDGKPRSRR